MTGVRAIVLAGGRGQRLAPFTVAFPKPLIPIGDIPVIEVVLRQLRWYGVDHVVISVGYLRHLIEAYFSTRGPIPGLEISWLREAEPLGTAGPVGMLGDVDEDLLVVNGDVLTTFDFGELIAFHRRERPALTIAVCQREIAVNTGVIETGPDGLVTAYREKPRLEYCCAMGINVYSARAVRLIEPGEAIDFPDLTRRALQRGERVQTFHTDCYWTDIGNAQDLARAVDEFPTRRHLLLPDEGPVSLTTDT